MTIDNYLGKEKSQVKQRGGKTMVLGDWSKTSHQNREGLNFLGRYRPHVQTTLSIPVFNLRTPVYKSAFPVHKHR